MILQTEHLKSHTRLQMVPSEELPPANLRADGKCELSRPFKLAYVSGLNNLKMGTVHWYWPKVQWYAFILLRTQ